MDVSENCGTPQIIHFNRVFHHKPSILGYPNSWKHPYLYLHGMVDFYGINVSEFIPSSMHPTIFLTHNKSGGLRFAYFVPSPKLTAKALNTWKIWWFQDHFPLGPGPFSGSMGVFVCRNFFLGDYSYAGKKSSGNVFTSKHRVIFFRDSSNHYEIWIFHGRYFLDVSLFVMFVEKSCVCEYQFYLKGSTTPNHRPPAKKSEWNGAKHGAIQPKNRKRRPTEFRDVGVSLNAGFSPKSSIKK